MTKGVWLKGSVIRKVNGHNAKFVKDFGLGPGAIVVIKKAGDVIPQIVKTIKKAQPQLPSKKDYPNWSYNETGVDIVLENNNPIEAILHFFSALKVERFSDGLIKSFYEHGFTTIPDILHMTKEQIIKEVPRQGDTSAQNIITEFAKLKSPGVNLADLLYASGCFGRGLGQGKFKDLYAQYGDDLVTGWQGSTLSDIAASIDEIPGFSNETGKQFAQGIKPFISFYKSIKDVIYIKKRKTATSGPLNGEIIVFSGFRNKTKTEKIEELGGEYSETLSRKTTILVVKNKSSISEKIAKAIKNGTKIMEEKELDRIIDEKL